MFFLYQKKDENFKCYLANCQVFYFKERSDMVPELIGKFRFLENGKEAPEGSRFTGVLNASSLIGWFNYTSREDAADERKDSQCKGGFLGYTSHGGSEKTYTHLGWLKDENYTEFRKEVAEAFSEKGNLAWDTVISMEDYDLADKYNMRTVDDWANAVSKALPRFFKSIGLEPSNMIYWMNYHTNKDHPHIHLTFLERTQSRTKGKITEKQLNTFKRFFIEELGLREKLAERVGTTSEEYMKQKDAYRNKIIESIKKSMIEVRTLEGLYKMLPKSGRLQYNSKNMAPYKKLIDEQIEECLKLDGIREVYEKWCETVNQLASAMNEFAGHDIQTIKQAEMKNLYTLVGNAILKDYKGRLDFQVQMEIDPSYIKESDSTFEIKVPFQPITVEVDRNKITMPENGNPVVLFDDIDYQIKEYGSKQDIYANRLPISTGTITTKEVLNIFNSIYKNKIYRTNIALDSLPGNLPGILMSTISAEEIVKTVEDGIVVRLPGTKSSFMIPKEDIFKTDNGNYIVQFTKDEYIVREHEDSEILKNDNILETHTESKERIFSNYPAQRTLDVKQQLDTAEEEKKLYFKPSIKKMRSYRTGPGFTNALKKDVMRSMNRDIAEKERDLDVYLQQRKEIG